MNIIEKFFKTNTVTKQDEFTKRYPTSNAHLSDAELLAFFRNILKTDFSEYTIEEDVPVTTLVGDVSDSFKLYKTRPNREYKAEWGRPYTFVMSQDGVIKAVVMLGGIRSHNSNVKYLIARMFAKKLDIPYIGFYTHKPNDAQYVKDRINKFLHGEA